MRATGKLAVCALAALTAMGGPAAAQWLSKPGDVDLAAAYPADALQAQLAGRAILSCVVRPDGGLADCAVDYESPQGRDFGAAALKLVPQFKMDMASSMGRAAQGKRVKLPVRFGAQPADPPLREAVFKATPRQYAWLAPVGPYWPDAALRAGVGGYAVVDCLVAEDGRLRDCKVSQSNPTNVGFPDSVLKMAQQGWMTAAPLGPGQSEPADHIWRFRVDFPVRKMR